MSEEMMEASTEAASTTEAAPKAKKPPTEVETVAMSDGRMVGFAGKRRMVKEIVAVDGRAGVRFDFRNGETRTFIVADSGLLMEFACHGASQKIGDETAGVEDVDDMVVAVDDMIARLDKREWKVERTGTGDSFSGASIVIKAICEATGKGVDVVKAFLDRKLAEAEAAGQKLTRRELYTSFRNPNSKTGQIIARMEKEKASKTAVNSDDLLAEV